jgi:hypothetical protein
VRERMRLVEKDGILIVKKTRSQFKDKYSFPVRYLKGDYGIVGMGSIVIPKNLVGKKLNFFATIATEIE